ncbi:MAG: bifunctional phosphoglucose/phosphomannose isomerase [Solirubrobacteraceae bacterium]
MADIEKPAPTAAPTAAATGPDGDGSTNASAAGRRQALSREAIGVVDTSGQIEDIIALPDQLRDALWRVESAMLTERDTAAGMVVAGMGGSGIGGALARAALGDQASRPMFVTRAYGLPTWTTPETTVLCSSYSGNTEETLACYESAGALGAQRIVATTGGKLAEMARADGVPVIPLPGGIQPRAAVAYMIVSALEVAALCGVGPRLTAEIDVAASHTEQLVEEWGPEAPEDSLAKSLARTLVGSVPVVAGAGLTVPIAYRWKTQINENAKQPCFSHELPELDHNELEGWAGAGAVGRFAAVFLDDSDAHPRVKERLELTAKLIAPNAAASVHVQTRGETGIERVISLVLLGDLLSVYLAVLRGVDPGPVTLIERLKVELASE